MQASLFEFRHRWWVFFSIFFAAFFAYSLDPVNCGVAITNWLTKRLGTVANDNSYRLTFAFGTLLLALAAILRTWGTSYLQAKVMRDSEVHTEKLLGDGPYRHVRNPLYLGNILMSAGIGLMASRIGFVVLSLGTPLCDPLALAGRSRIVARPRRTLPALLPRLVPSLTPRLPSAGNTPHWAQGFRAELMYWLLALAVGAFAITLNMNIFWGIFILAMASSWLLKSPKAKHASTLS